MRSLVTVVVMYMLLGLGGCRSGAVEVRRHTGGDTPVTSTGAVGIVSCANEYDQFAKNVEGTVSLAKKLEVEGRVTSQELIQIDQDAALLSARYNNACNFFIHHRITFQEYRQEVDKAHAEYANLRKFVLERTP